jgi:hypothetical protein
MIDAVHRRLTSDARHARLAVDLGRVGVDGTTSRGAGGAPARPLEKLRVAGHADDGEPLERPELVDLLDRGHAEFRCRCRDPETVGPGRWACQS